MSLKLEVNGICDKGLKRETNQDRILIKAKDETALLVIADGMGGHTHGERASEHIVYEFEKWYEIFDCDKYQNDFNNMVINIQDQLEQINKAIYNFYSDNTICGSTVVVVFVYRDMYAVFWAGDSRGYIMDKWRFKLLTFDDVWENQPEVRNNLSIEQIKENPNCGKLVNSIGIAEHARINIRTDRLKKGTKLMICSDGLYKMCSEIDIKKIMRRYRGNKGGSSIMEDCLNMVYKHGAKDNVSMVIAYVVDI